MLNEQHKRKVACDITHLAQKKWLTKSCNSCWKGIAPTSAYGVILINDVKSIMHWNELLPVCDTEKHKFN